MNIFLILLEVLITYFLVRRASNPSTKQQFLIALVAPVAVFGVMIMPLIIFSTESTAAVIRSQVITFLLGFAFSYVVVLFFTDS